MFFPKEKLVLESCEFNILSLFKDFRFKNFWLNVKSFVFVVLNLLLKQNGV